MKKKGFTLIELLAVIIILGILMLIAIPSVTSYINSSRKNTYASTIHEVIKGTVARVNNGDLDMYDTDTTYYIPATAINLEGSKLQSPYGEIEDAYVVVTYDGESYDYYYVGKDKANVGIGTVTKGEEINKDKIATDIGNIDTTVGIGGRSKVVVFDKDLVAGVAQGAQSQGGSGGSNGSSGSSAAVLVNAGETVYFDPVSESPCSESNEGTGTCYKWSVLSESGSKVTIMLNESIAYAPWISAEDYGSTPAKTDKGPITLLNELKAATSTWSRAPLLNYNYTMTTPSSGDSRYSTWDGYKGYENLSCTNGTCKIHDGTTIVTDLRARVITAEEVVALTNAAIDYESATPSVSQTWTTASGGVVYVNCDNEYLMCNYNNYHVFLQPDFNYYNEYGYKIGVFDYYSNPYDGAGSTKLAWLSNALQNGTGLTLSSSVYTSHPTYGDTYYVISIYDTSIGSTDCEDYNEIYPVITIEKSLLTY